MESNRHKLGAASLALLLVAGAGMLVLGRVTHSLAAQVGTVFAGLGLVVTAVSLLQMRLEEQERLERLEVEELTKSASPGSNLFAQESETLRARRAREQFEKYFIPGLTALLLLAEVAGAILLWRWLAKPVTSPLQQHTAVMAVSGLFALLLFMLGKYVTGIVRLEKSRFLRPTAGFLLLNAYVCVTVAGTAAAEWAEFRAVDLWVARLFCGVLFLIAAETLAGLVLEIYRPHLKGKEGRLLYDSRLVGLLSQPESLVTTMAHALDYQFGFKVSETWFYRFLERALAWVVLAQLGILALSTTLVMIEPGEQALLERFGRRLAGREILGPGLHFKLPWPVDRVYRYRTDQVQRFMIGMVPGDEKEPQTVLWTVGHAKEEYNLLVASREALFQTNLDTGKKVPPVNLLAVNIPVQYQITNLLDWAYKHAEAKALLEQLATREVVRYLVNADIHEIMTVGRGRAAQALRQRIQEAASRHELGVQILFVGLAGIHPPVDVASAYEKVVAAMQQAAATNLAAQAYATNKAALAGASAYRKEQEALAEKLRRERAAQADAIAFSNQMLAFAAAPAVYAARAELEVLSRAGVEPRKYVLAATNTQDVLQFNFEEKIGLNLLRAATPPPTPAPAGKSSPP